MTDTITLPRETVQQKSCWCETCDTQANHGMRTRMSLCPECGNKRCPKAAHHDNACTGSNEAGQKGSSWENVKPAASQPEPKAGEPEVIAVYSGTGASNGPRIYTDLVAANAAIAKKDAALQACVEEMEKAEIACSQGGTAIAKRILEDAITQAKEQLK